MFKLLSDLKAYEVPKYASLIVAAKKHIQGHTLTEKHITEADVWIHITCKQVDVSVLSSINWNRGEQGSQSFIYFQFSNIKNEALDF